MAFASRYVHRLAILPLRSVLDVGCSHGKGVSLLWKHGINASGCDISPTAIELARSTREQSRKARRYFVDSLRVEERLEAAFSFRGRVGEIDPHLLFELSHRVLQAAAFWPSHANMTTHICYRTIIQLQQCRQVSAALLR